MIKAIIFDCFGVLVTDAATNAFEALGGDWEKHDKQVKNLYRAYDLGHISFEDEHKQIAALLEVPYEQWLLEMEKQTSYNRPLAAYIRTLPFKKAMMSNIGQQSLAALHEELGLDTLMDELIISSEVGFVKPDHRIYEVGAERLGVAPQECVFVDDLPANTEGAKAVGMHTILFENVSQFRKELELLIQD